MNNPAKMKKYIKRDIESRIIPFLDRPEVIAILGPRQAGKTTFISHLAELLEERGQLVRFITFENLSDRALFENDIESFKARIQGDKVVIIDEFQYAREGGQKLKYLYDTTDTKFIISGSSSLELRFKTGAYMVGRMVTFMLWPFSFNEYLRSVDESLPALLHRIDESTKAVTQKLLPYFHQYLVWGGYPAVATALAQDMKNTVLEGIYENYLLRDIKDLLSLTTDKELVSLIRFLSVQTGNLISYQDLSNISGLYYQSVKEHLSILQQTYILNLVRPYAVNKRKELTKQPKVYFEDLGFRNIGISDFTPIEHRGDIGALVENFVYIHLRFLTSELKPIYFWRTKSGAEVDFLLASGEDIIPIEVKYNDKDNIGKSFTSYIKKYSPKKAIIFTKEFRGMREFEGCNVQFFPALYCQQVLERL